MFLEFLVSGFWFLVGPTRFAAAESIQWVTVRKPKEFSRPLIVIAETKKETVRTPTVVWDLVPWTSVDQGLREFSRFSEVISLPRQ